MKTVAIAAGLALALAAPAAGQTPGGWTLEIPKAPLDVAHLIHAGPDGRPILALSCRKNTGQIAASFEASENLASGRRGEVWIDRIGRPAPWAVSVAVVSGPERTTLRGQARPSPAGGSTVSVEVSDRAPVLAAWRKSAVLRLESLGSAVEPPPARKSLIGRFLGYCG